MRDGHARGSNSGRVLRHAKKTSRVQQQYPVLAPQLLQLRNAVPVLNVPGVHSIPPSAVPRTVSSRKLLLALRCLQAWEAQVHLVEHQGVPMLLQVLLYSKQQQVQSVSAEGADVVDLASQEDDEQQQLTLDDDAELLVVKVVEPPQRHRRRRAAAARGNSGGDGGGSRGDDATGPQVLSR